MRIGYNHENYACQRNIIGMIPHIDYVRVHDYYEAMQKLGTLNRKIFKWSLIDVDKRINRFNDFNINRVDILHFFNDISFGKIPWVSTFETILPRFTHRYRDGKRDIEQIFKKRILSALEAISRDSCKRLIALSEHNLMMQKQFLRKYPQYHLEIESKLTQLHPPQELFIDKYENLNRTLSGQLIFMFVGGAFFRKGGMEIIETLDNIRKNSEYDLRLIIVSSLSKDYYHKNIDEESITNTQKIIEKNKDWIDCYSHLSNEQVIALMQQSNIGLLPTYSDTYGYSVLEFQACGCPVVSTNIRALPEINNNEIGWVIEVPKDHLGDAMCSTNEDRERIKTVITEGLEKAVLEICRDRDLIEKKANAAIEKIRIQHSIEDYIMKLGSIYNQALG